VLAGSGLSRYRFFCLVNLTANGGLKGPQAHLATGVEKFPASSGKQHSDFRIIMHAIMFKKGTWGNGT
jgi:hypothetical protein